ncbi:heme o synthase [Caulobacter sp. 17J65-9]|uniref:heme o synthase n=1 Tax=Caulobacter sp. 17J65-9 TaxID=2709382 RepID=UPI0013CCCA23|nr:heme o synthase [Caulobacter sp. 17J65-9]NEX93539.1 protoheme IX farnesyltransferase [Caulobacter sp. 17J65-9]
MPQAPVDAPVAKTKPPALPQDYFQLLKPRVMSLVIFTALTGLVAAPGKIHWFLAAVAVFCVAVGAGAAGALNMAIEGETDALMRRTRGRPVAAGRVAKGDAFAFGVILSAFAVMLMGMAVNWLAAGLLAFTVVYYAWFYTVLLKRSTPQNIVIGGAAGALPPVIGWAAADGSLALNAWLMFAIIFVWTPPHSWALALYTSDDYAKAGIPMMPVAKGPKSTRLQIFLYSLVLAPLAVVPVFTGLGGWLYGVIAVCGGLAFVGLAWRVYRSRAGEKPGEREEGLYDVKAEAKTARDLFAFSILYLFALFAALLVEHGIPGVA